MTPGTWCWQLFYNYSYIAHYSSILYFFQSSFFFWWPFIHIFRIRGELEFRGWDVGTCMSQCPYPKPSVGYCFLIGWMLLHIHDELHIRLIWLLPTGLFRNNSPGRKIWKFFEILQWVIPGSVWCEAYHVCVYKPTNRKRTTDRWSMTDRLYYQ